MRGMSVFLVEWQPVSAIAAPLLKCVANQSHVVVAWVLTSLPSKITRRRQALSASDVVAADAQPSMRDPKGVPGRPPRRVQRLPDGTEASVDMLANSPRYRSLKALRLAGGGGRRVSRPRAPSHKYGLACRLSCTRPPNALVAEGYSHYPG
jgi:hypothetical protein